MADAGVPLHVLRKIAGHGSLATTQRYLHPDAQSITAAGAALSAHLSAKRSPDGPQLRVVQLIAGRLTCYFFVGTAGFEPATP